MDKAAYFLALRGIRESLPEHKRAAFDFEFQVREKNPATALVLGLALGAFGVDRFYLGQVWIGLLKIALSLLTAWVAAVVDLFLIQGATRKRNVGIATGIATEIGRAHH